MQIYIARLQKFSDALSAENNNVFSFTAKVQTVQFNIRSSGGRLSLASVKSRLVLFFWYRLTRVVLDKGPLNEWVCVYVCVCDMFDC